jgi:uncharacterized protein YyaL (SSP411 family)
MNPAWMIRKPIPNPACAADPKASAIELLGARFQLEGRPTAFVCREFACRQPVVEPEALAAQLMGHVGSWLPSDDG